MFWRKKSEAQVQTFTVLRKCACGGSNFRPSKMVATVFCTTCGAFHRIGFYVDNPVAVISEITKQ